MKQELLKRQNDKRNEVLENPNEKEINEKLNKELEDMCIFGNIMKNQIREEKIKNPEKYIEINDALNLENEDPRIIRTWFALQYFRTKWN